MNIQPPSIASYNTNFCAKRATTKIPRGLGAKPKTRVSKGVLISMIPLSMLTFGISYWQIHKDEAENKFWQKVFEEFMKEIEKLNDASSSDTVVSAPLSCDTIVTPPLQADTISYHDAVKFDK